MAATIPESLKAYLLANNFEYPWVMKHRQQRYEAALQSLKETATLLKHANPNEKEALQERQVEGIQHLDICMGNLMTVMFPDQYGNGKPRFTILVGEDADVNHLKAALYGESEDEEGNDESDNRSEDEGFEDQEEDESDDEEEWEDDEEEDTAPITEAEKTN